jgi:hypothetical protein
MESWGSAELAPLDEKRLHEAGASDGAVTTLQLGVSCRQRRSALVPLLRNLRSPRYRHIQMAPCWGELQSLMTCVPLTH